MSNTPRMLYQKTKIWFYAPYKQFALIQKIQVM